MAWHEGLDRGSVAYAIAADDARNIRVLAGPGTGKSFALKRRVAKLLESDVEPALILPVTFTKVAAEDLHRELVHMGVEGCEAIQGSTLHSLGMRILNRQNVLATTGRIARPLNRFEMEPLLYDLPRTFGNKRARQERIRAYEAAWARLQPEQPGFAQTRLDRDFEHILTGWLRFHAGMLIGEIIPELYRYLRNNPGAPERALYDHVLVDEYQDLNKAEQAVIDLLAGNASLCIVGDDDQSIYSFKFAHPEGIRTFGQTHLGSTDHALVDCYRCPTGVVSIANSLIANNRDRDGRVLSPVAANGAGTIQIVQFHDVAREARGIATFIDHQINQEGHAPSDVLVLAQRRVIGTPIHEALRARGIPSKSYYQESELDNEVAQERLAMFKLLINRSDRIALRWLLGSGSQDFRAGAYARLRGHCKQTGDSPWEAMSKLEAGELNLPHCRHLVARFHAIKNELRYLEEHTDTADFVGRWLRAEFAGAAELGLLVASVLPEAESAEDLLSKVVEAVTQPEIPPDVTEVRVMSLHKSKGLSAPVVVIAGCIEGLLPAEPDAALPPAERAAMLEEQRRLFYVGVTRVKADPASNKPGVLLLTGSRTLTLADAMRSNIHPARQQYGVVYVHLSRFIQELGGTAPAPEAG
jgi:DNA helicase-2/ATP-dependent DNA helicase PcrA